MTRKSLLLGASLAVTFASGASANERTRATSADPSDSGLAAAPAVSLTNVRQLSTGVGAATVNGKDVTLRVDGSIRYDDVVAQYGSVERMKFESAVANVPSTLDSDGSTLFANGATGYFNDLLGANMPKPAPRTVAELKKIRPWIDQVVDGVTVLAFVDGVVLNDSSVAWSEPAWVSHRENVPNKVDSDGFRHYADNAVFMEPAVEPKDGQ